MLTFTKSPSPPRCKHLTLLSAHKLEYPSLHSQLLCHPLSHTACILFSSIAFTLLNNIIKKNSNTSLPTNRTVSDLICFLHEWRDAFDKSGPCQAQGSSFWQILLRRHCHHCPRSRISCSFSFTFVVKSCKSYISFSINSQARSCSAAASSNPSEGGSLRF